MRVYKISRGKYSTTSQLLNSDLFWAVVGNLCLVKVKVCHQNYRIPLNISDKVSRNHSGVDNYLFSSP